MWTFPPRHNVQNVALCTETQQAAAKAVENGDAHPRPEPGKVEGDASASSSQATRTSATTETGRPIKSAMKSSGPGATKASTSGGAGVAGSKQGHAELKLPPGLGQLSVPDVIMKEGPPLSPIPRPAPCPPSCHPHSASTAVIARGYVVLNACAAGTDVRCMPDLSPWHRVDRSD